MIPTFLRNVPYGVILKIFEVTGDKRKPKIDTKMNICKQ